MTFIENIIFRSKSSLSAHTASYFNCPPLMHHSIQHPSGVVKIECSFADLKSLVVVSYAEAPLTLSTATHVACSKKNLLGLSDVGFLRSAKKYHHILADFAIFADHLVCQVSSDYSAE